MVLVVFVFVEVWSFHLGYLIYWHTNIPVIFLLILFIYVRLVAMTPLLFLILVIQVFPPTDLSILLILSENKLLILLILYVVFPLSTSFVSTLFLIISLSLLLWDEFTFLFLVWWVQSQVHCFQIFFNVAVYSYKYPSNTTFCASCKFRYVVFLFHSIQSIF